MNTQDSESSYEVTEEKKSEESASFMNIPDDIMDEDTVDDDEDCPFI